jgi:uncharacterized repeat protein (TIGR01451 family)
VALASHHGTPGGLGRPTHHEAVCPACNPAAALPPSAFLGHGPLSPTAVALEYLCNGGDKPPEVLVGQDWSVYGLHAGDAVVHYDTLDGRVEVVATSDVCLYAPRFAAVRKVTGVVLHEQHEREGAVALPVGPAESGETAIANTVTQPIQPRRHLAVRSTQRFHEQTRGAGLENEQALAAAQGALRPYEDFLLIRRGQFDNTEKARLAIRLDAAAIWTHELGVQVVIDRDAAFEAAGEAGLQSVYRYELPPGKPRLCVAKVASTESAQVGELVEFTLRFDNVGDQTIGNLTIVDHLVTRLEYVPESQQCSLSADFFTQENDSESLTLRWEIRDPLPVGEGGVIRFRCRVR